MPNKQTYALLRGGPGNNRVVLVVPGQRDFNLPLTSCSTGIIHYGRLKQQSDFLYIRSTEVFKGMPIFKFNRESDT